MHVKQIYIFSRYIGYAKIGTLEIGRLFFKYSPADRKTNIFVPRLLDTKERFLKGLGRFQRLKMGTFLLFFFIDPMKYFIQTVYHIKDTYLMNTL